MYMYVMSVGTFVLFPWSMYVFFVAIICVYEEYQSKGESSENCTQKIIFEMICFKFIQL